MHRHAARTLLLCLPLAACGDDPGDTTTEAATTDAGGSTGASTGGAGEAVTYHRDAKAILDAKCVTCHSPGNIAPFSLATFADAHAFSATLPPVLDDGTMPPWPPDAACRSYKHDRSLTAAEKQTLRDWVAAGAPEGDPADAPAPPEPPAAIDYDVALELPLAYTPTIAPDEYRCFLLPWPEDQDSFVTALTVTPGSRQIVHHVIAYKIEPDDIPVYQALDDADPDPGYLCYGGPGGDTDGRAGWLGAWVPGSSGGETPAGTGVHVAPGSMLAVQLHYHTFPGAPPDRSKIQIRTAPTVEREAVVMPFTNVKWVQNTEPMLIPAGEADVVHSFEADLAKFLPIAFPDGPFAPGEPFVLHAAALHMHTLGKRGSLRLTGGATDCLLDIPRWDFNWQGNYQLTAPVTVRPGDKLGLECHWDNSAANQPVVNGVQQAPQDVVWGEGTGDEMCLGVVYITAP